MRLRIAWRAKLFVMETFNRWPNVAAWRMVLAVMFWGIIHGNMPDTTEGTGDDG